MKSFEDDTVIGVTGSVFPLWESESLKWLPEQFYWLISCTAWTGLQKKQTIRGVLGANMAFRNGAFTNGALFSTNAGYTDAHHYNPVSDDLEFSLRIRQETGRTIMYSLGPKVWHRVNKKRLCWRYVTAKSQEVGRCRRILKKQYARELGKFEQERLVLHGLLNTFIHVPKKLFTQPFLALKELILILVVLISVGIGYILPLPMYSPIRGNVPN